MPMRAKAMAMNQNVVVLSASQRVRPTSFAAPAASAWAAASSSVMPSGSRPTSWGCHLSRNAPTTRTTKAMPARANGAICQLPETVAAGMIWPTTREPGNMADQMMAVAMPRRLLNQLLGMPERMTIPPRAEPMPMTT